MNTICRHELSVSTIQERLYYPHSYHYLSIFLMKYFSPTFFMKLDQGQLTPTLENQVLPLSKKKSMEAPQWNQITLETGWSKELKIG